MSLPVAHCLVGGAILETFRPRLGFLKPRAALALALVLPLVPDFDFAFVWFLGLPVTVWHRTFSHSLLFAAALGLVAALWVRRRGTPGAGAAFGFVASLVASHAVLDMCGHGHGTPGRGVMLAWPFDTTYFALPWQFLPPGRHGHPEVYLRTALLEFLLVGPACWAYVRGLRLWRGARARSAAGTPDSGATTALPSALTNS